MKGYQGKDPTPFCVDVIERNGKYGLGGILVFRTEVLPIGGAEGELSRPDDFIAGIQGLLPLWGTGIDLCIQVELGQYGLGGPIIGSGVGSGGLVRGKVWNVFLQF